MTLRRGSNIVSWPSKLPYLGLRQHSKSAHFLVRSLSVHPLPKLPLSWRPPLFSENNDSTITPHQTYYLDRQALLLWSLQYTFQGARNQILEGGDQVRHHSLICLEGKSITLRWGSNILSWPSKLPYLGLWQERDSRFKCQSQSRNRTRYKKFRLEISRNLSRESGTSDHWDDADQFASWHGHQELSQTFIVLVKTRLLLLWQK